MAEKGWSPFSEKRSHDGSQTHSFDLELSGTRFSEDRRGKTRLLYRRTLWIALALFACAIVSLVITSLVSKDSLFVPVLPASTRTGTAAGIASTSALSRSTFSVAATTPAPASTSGDTALSISTATLVPLKSGTSKPLASATSISNTPPKSIASTSVPSTTLVLIVSPTPSTLILPTTAIASATFTPINNPELLVEIKTAPPSCGSTNPPASSAGRAALAGVNIAGCEFGTDTTGTQPLTSATCPLGPSYNRSDGPGQMMHFTQSGFNIFRLPVTWQFLISNNITASGNLNATNLAKYDFLVQNCLATGAYCIIDIHNYARFSGSIIGQGGPADTVFVQLWTSLATKYKSQKNIVFGVMNEPHDLPSLAAWGATVQKVVTAIRNAGANTQIILIPGTDFSSALSLVSKSMPYLSNIVNPDGTYTGLVFDIHKYIDASGAGIVSTCVDTQVDSTWATLTQWLRCHGRMALLTETGGGSTPSCDNYLCQLVSYINTNSDVYLGYLGWSAGSFSLTYPLSLTPSFANGFWTDSQILKQCLVPR